MDDAPKFCPNQTLPEVFSEVRFEINSAKAVAALDPNAVVDCLVEMSSVVSESFLQDNRLLYAHNYMHTRGACMHSVWFAGRTGRDGLGLGVYLM